MPVAMFLSHVMLYDIMEVFVLYSHIHRLAVEPTQPSVQWILGFLF
jgi:hypothetical protein